MIIFVVIRFVWQQGEKQYMLVRIAKFSQFNLLYYGLLDAKFSLKFNQSYATCDMSKVGDNFICGSNCKIDSCLF